MGFDPNLVASVTTVGSPHSGIFSDASKIGTTYFPDGQDNWLDPCEQTSCFQMGVPASIDFPERLLIGLSDENDNVEISGAFAYRYSYFDPTPFPSTLNLQVLIGITKGNNSNDLYTWQRLQEGDALISYDGQRLHPELLM